MTDMRFFAVPRHLAEAETPTQLQEDERAKEQTRGKQRSVEPWSHRKRFNPGLRI